MRTVVSSFFESKIRRDGVSEDGTPCKVNELYVVNAMSFTECEERITKYLSSLFEGEFEVLTESHAPFGEVFFSDKEKEELYFRVKVDFQIIDERTGRPKHSKSNYLVQGASIESAKKNVDDVLKESMVEYRILSVIETAVQDVVFQNDKKD